MKFFVQKDGLLQQIPDEEADQMKMSHIWGAIDCKIGVFATDDEERAAANIQAAADEAANAERAATEAEQKVAADAVMALQRVRNAALIKARTLGFTEAEIQILFPG